MSLESQATIIWRESPLSAVRRLGTACASVASLISSTLERVEVDKETAMRLYQRVWCLDRNPGALLIQLADMCVGAVARAAREPVEGNRWLRMLGSRVENVWRFR